MSKYLCLCAFKKNSKTYVKIQKRPLPDHLEHGQVLIRASYSSLNYKDALAVTGKGTIIQKFRLIPGIDVSGVIEETNSKRFTQGQEVLITGSNLGQSIDGGFSQYVVADDDKVIPLAENLSLKTSMIIGTAGFTAALALWKMEKNGQTPQDGPLFISGASGGVGSFAVKLAKSKGYTVWTLSSSAEKKDYLLSLGSDKLFTLDELDPENAKPLGKGLLGGGMDNIGGPVLHWILSHTRTQGNVSSIGLALDYRLSTTVMPFILRGVNLFGISSNNCPYNLRTNIWQSWSDYALKENIETLLQETISLEDIHSYSEKMLNKQTKGRYLIQLT